MWDFGQPYFSGKLIAAEDAWKRLNAWRESGKEIGAWYVAKSGSVRALGTVESARRGRLVFRGDSARAGFRLKNATFAYYPIGIYPRWPMGPVFEVMALQAFFETGEWLMLAEGMKPEALPAPKRIGGSRA